VTRAGRLEARRLRPADLARLATVGLRTRKLRAGLSALGIAIGVAAIVAVLGLSSSASAGLQREIAALGTNLLVVQNGESLSGQAAELPDAAPAMIRRIDGVTRVEDVGSVTATAFRSRLIPRVTTNALSVEAATVGLLRVVGVGAAEGSFLNAATAREPVCVLGATAAQRLGIDRVFTGERIWLDGMWFYVGGVLEPVVSVPDLDTLDSAVLVGFPAAERYLGFDGHPSSVFVRAQTTRVDAVDALLGPTANPQFPNEVDVSQPSAALAAQADAKGTFDGLFLGLGAVALLVGALGVANIMIISVLERRSEIGLRRALGATRGHIRVQFLAEAVLLTLGGGAVGVCAGALSTAVYASSRHELVVVPVVAWVGGLGAATLIGALAGLWPAVRAARMSPTDALWSV
jgi:putative ABC transport system permease protein